METGDILTGDVNSEYVNAKPNILQFNKVDEDFITGGVKRWIISPIIFLHLLSFIALALICHHFGVVVLPIGYMHVIRNTIGAFTNNA